MDRNNQALGAYVAICLSLSARRAWIEMLYALVISQCNQSLSARRAWIEITVDFEVIGGESKVALRKESVDRNACLIMLPV